MMQVIQNPQPQSSGAAVTGHVFLTLGLLGLVFSFVMMMEDAEIGFCFFWSGCLMTFIAVILYLAAPNRSQLRAVVLQQPMAQPMQVVHHHHHAQQARQQVQQQRPVQQPQQVQRPPQQAPVKAKKVKKERLRPVIDAEEMQKKMKKARNLEKARDFEAAANLYQEIGLYDEAGRIRQSHIEDTTPLVSIGKVGDTHVSDSVIMGDAEASMKCHSCQADIQQQWNVCPHCQATLQ